MTYRVRCRLVQTNMGNSGARLFGMGEPPVPTKNSVNGVLAPIYW